MFDSHVGEQEVLADSGVRAEGAVVRLVIDVEELVVEKQLLILAHVVAELALEPTQVERRQ